MNFEGTAFKEIPGYKRYYASACGKILSAARGKKVYIKKTELAENGYRRVSLRLKNRNIKRAVHQMVARAWIGLPPEGKTQINHKNGKKTDNRCENLEWVSHKENQSHWRTHLHEQPRGTALKWAKLTDDHIRRIRLAAAHLSHRELARAFQVERSTVARVLRGETWQHIK